MLYKQHKHVGDGIVVGKNVEIFGFDKAKGRVVFSKKEKIDLTDVDFYKEVISYNSQIKGKSLEWFRVKVEHGDLSLQVRRTFGDVNAWAGDHAKLYPPDGQVRKFEDLKVSLQEIYNNHDLEYFKLATSNWDHFMPMSYRIWWLFHKEALRLARKWYRTRGKAAGFVQEKMSNRNVLVFDLAKSDLAKALFLEGYAAHFLEDCYASGHLRTPRILFGAQVVQGLMSKSMHDEDNARRLESQNKEGRWFRLCGEDGDLDDFAKRKDDAVLMNLEAEVTKTLAVSVQQVLDVAYAGKMPGRVRYADIGDRLPRVDVSWQALGKKRSRTHALEIWPVPGAMDTPKPLFKIHANYNAKKRRFEDPILIKRSSRTGWRRVPLVTIRAFTPGEKHCWWIPAHPDETMTLP